MNVKLSALRESFAKGLRIPSIDSGIIAAIQFHNIVIDRDISWPAGQTILDTYQNHNDVAAAFDSHYSALARSTLDACSKDAKTYLLAIPKDCRDIILSYFRRDTYKFSGWGGIGVDIYKSTFMGLPHGSGDNAAKYEIVENELRMAKWFTFGQLHRAVGPCIVEYDLNSITLGYSYDPVPASPHLAPFIKSYQEGIYLAKYSPPTRFAKMKAYPPAIRDPFILAESQILAFESRRCGHPVECWRNDD